MVSTSFNLTVPKGGAIYFVLNATDSTALGDTLGVDELVVRMIDDVMPSATVSVPYNGTFDLTVRGEAPAPDQFIVLDGVTYYPTSGSDGDWSFHLANLTAGDHVLEFGIRNIYAFMLTSSDFSASHSTVNIQFIQVSNTDYEITVTTDGPAWIMIQDSYDRLWDAGENGEYLIHVKANSMVNAYYVEEAGTHIIHIRFIGQDIYENVLIVYGASILACTAILVFTVSPESRHALWGRIRALSRRAPASSAPLDRKKDEDG